MNVVQRYYIIRPVSYTSRQNNVLFQIKNFPTESRCLRSTASVLTAWGGQVCLLFYLPRWIRELYFNPKLKLPGYSKSQFVSVFTTLITINEFKLLVCQVAQITSKSSKKQFLDPYRKSTLETQNVLILVGIIKNRSWLCCASLQLQRGEARRVLIPLLTPAWGLKFKGNSSVVHSYKT